MGKNIKPNIFKKLQRKKKKKEQKFGRSCDAGEEE